MSTNENTPAARPADNRTKAWGYFMIAASVVLGILVLSSPAQFTRLLSTRQTPTPHYAPLSGWVFITTFESDSNTKCLVNRPDLVGLEQQTVSCKSHGTPVEILQWVWQTQLKNRQNCYYYLVRTDDGQGGWIDGGHLTIDPDQPPQESCRLQPTPTP